MVAIMLHHLKYILPYFNSSWRNIFKASLRGSLLSLCLLMMGSLSRFVQKNLWKDLSPPYSEISTECLISAISKMSMECSPCRFVLELFTESSLSIISKMSMESPLSFLPEMSTEWFLSVLLRKCLLSVLLPFIPLELLTESFISVILEMFNRKSLFPHSGIANGELSPRLSGNFYAELLLRLFRNI